MLRLFDVLHSYAGLLLEATRLSSYSEASTPSLPLAERDRKAPHRNSPQNSPKGPGSWGRLSCSFRNKANQHAPTNQRIGRLIKIGYVFGSQGRIYVLCETVGRRGTNGSLVSQNTYLLKQHVTKPLNNQNPLKPHFSFRIIYLIVSYLHPSGCTCSSSQ